MLPLITLAQTPLKGSYVLSEEDKDISMLAVLNFDGGSTFIGSAITQSRTGVTEVNLFGSYDTTARTITLRKTVTTEDGNAEVVSAAYRYQTLRNGQLAAQRTGEAGVARLFPPATESNLTGSYAVLSDSLANWTFKADGSITGPSGSFTKSSAGLGRITINVLGTGDEDGNPTPGTQTYVYATTAAGEI